MPDETALEQAVHTDRLVPTDRDKQPFASNGNDAAILGHLDEWHRWSIRTGHFTHFFAYRAVSVGSKVAILHPSAQALILHPGLDHHGFQDPAPEDFAARTAAIDIARAAASKSAITWPTTIAQGSVFLANPIAVNTEDSHLLTSLGYVFGAHYDDLVEDAAGSGLAFLAALRARAAAATTADLAVLTADFDSVKSEGVKGELSLESLKSFERRYKVARRHLPPASRPGAPTEVQMINLIAFRDSSLFNLYEMKAEANAPTTLEEAIKLVRGILTSRVRSEELEQATSGSKQTGLAATKVQAGRAALVGDWCATHSLDRPYRVSINRVSINQSPQVDLIKINSSDHDKQHIPEQIANKLDCPGRIAARPGGLENKLDCPGRDGARPGGLENEPDCPGRDDARPGGLENKLVHPSASHKSVTSWSTMEPRKGTPRKGQGVKYPPGLNVPFTAGTPSAGSTLGGSKTIGTTTTVGVASNEAGQPPTDVVDSNRGDINANQGYDLSLFGAPPVASAAASTTEPAGGLASSPRSPQPHAISRALGASSPGATAPGARNAARSVLRATTTDIADHQDHRITDTVDKAASHLALAASASDSVASRVIAAATSKLSSTASLVTNAVARLSLLAHPDSGCTGSMTPHEDCLINKRPCNEKFRAANGFIAKATCIGDLPAVLISRSGKPVVVTFTNVRCVPHFTYTLLSPSSKCGVSSASTPSSLTC